MKSNRATAGNVVYANDFNADMAAIEKARAVWGVTGGSINKASGDPVAASERNTLRDYLYTVKSAAESATGTSYTGVMPTAATQGEPVRADHWNTYIASATGLENHCHYNCHSDCHSQCHSDCYTCVRSND